MRPRVKDSSLGDGQVLLKEPPCGCGLPRGGEGVAETVCGDGGSWHYLQSSDFPPPLFSLVLHPGMTRSPCWDGAADLLGPLAGGPAPQPIPLDLPAAFDTVDHEEMWPCLRTLAGVDGSCA